MRYTRRYMRKVKIKPLHSLIALIIAVIAIIAVYAISLGNSVIALAAGSFKITDYDVTYDVNNDRRISVTENMTVHYSGSRGFIKDIPVNAGEQVKNVRLTEMTEDGQIATDFKVQIDLEYLSFVSVVIGDDYLKYDTHVYTLTYDYCLTRAQEGENLLYLNAIGTEHEGFDNANVTIIVPEGYVRSEYYIGKLGSNYGVDFEDETVRSDGKAVLSLKGLNLRKGEGVTFMIEFEKGTLTTYSEFAPYWFVIAAAVLIVIIILVKILFFNENLLMPVVHFEAPDDMDPMMMGKLIDNKVNPEDVTSLIFYWADKGYVKINLDNAGDPVIIRIKDLPDTAQDYEKRVFNGLFVKGDAVKTSSLKNTFYTTFEKAAALINAKTKKFYTSNSMGVSILFALLGGILLGGAPLILGLTAVSGTLRFLYGFLALLPGLILYAVTESVKYNKPKRNGKKNALYIGLIILIILISTGLFMLIIPSSLIPILPKALLCVLCFSAMSLAIIIESRTHEYNETLNDIVGFREFILSAEKDKLEALLESDPEYYYHVLPYAQVLDVSNIWEDKFKSLTVEAPNWVISSHTAVFNFAVVNLSIKHSLKSISSNMVSKPSSSGHSGHGGFGGGHGGGHVGGGHGGGGFRGR